MADKMAYSLKKYQIDVWNKMLEKMLEKMIERMAEVECQRKCQNNKISEIRKCIPLSINFRTRCLKL